MSKIRITEGQRVMLERMVSGKELIYDRMMGYRFRGHGYVHAKTADGALHRGLIERVNPFGVTDRFEITDAGRAALAATTEGERG